jgi:hypothetical protein
MFRFVSVRPLALHAVEVAERFADSEESAAELQAAAKYALSAAEHACMNAVELPASPVMADCAALNAAWGATQPGPIMPDDGGASAAKLAREQASQCDLLRDIFGNPLHTRPLESNWQTSTVRLLAQAIYTDRTFEHLPVLADALEDAGCTNTELLSHLRGGGEHVRGCWAVDLVLARQ